MQRFGEWLPDLAGFQNPGTDHVLNVLPLAGHYGPIRAFSSLTNPLDTPCRGAISIQDMAGTVRGYAGDTAKLYKLNSGDTWVDASKPGGYTTPGDDHWSYVEFGDLIIATNGSDAPQKIVPTVSAAFADLGGAPPVAKYAAVVRNHVVFGNLSGQRNGIHWSAFEDPEGWTVGTDQSDFQNFPDSGWVQGLVGGEVGYVFTESQIIRMAATGDEFIFQFDVIERARGLKVPSSLITVGRKTFFIAHDGFYAMVDGVAKPIGAHKVDRFFLKDLNSSLLQQVSVAADPVNKIVTWSYPSVQSDNTPDKIISYNWVTGQWAQGEIDLYWLYTLLGQGQTLEGLDTMSASLDALPFSLDSRVWMGGNLIQGAFSVDRTMGGLTGDTLAAQIDSKEATLSKGRRSQVLEVTPMVDAEEATVRVGKRERQSDDVVWSNPYVMEVSGRCMTRDAGRYHRARVEIPAGAVWSEAQGVDFRAVPLGSR